MKDILNVGESLSCGQMLVSRNNMFRAIMQEDGNFVVYDNLDKAIWATKTNGKGGKILTMQADNNLVIYTDTGKAVWSAKSNKKNSKPQLIMQNDQNLVIYNLNDGKACWSIDKGKPKEEWRWSTNNWMQQSYKLIKDKTLRDICIPGSHDSGMYYRGISTKGAFDCNVLTQSLPIYDQLVYGFRYFDIRPVYLPLVRKFLMGHFTEPLPVLGIQGACSVDIDKLIDDVNKYTKYNNELIILNISHELNLTTEKKLTGIEWEELLTLITDKLKNLLIISNFDNLNEDDLLLNKKISEFIDSKPAVVVIIPNINDEVFNKFKYQGIYRRKSLDPYDNYSDTNSVERMIEDQIQKLQYVKYYNPREYFLLSWTLTQSTKQAATCMLPFGGDDIKDLANRVNNKFDAIKPTLKDYKPNIFYIDNIKDNTLTTFIVDNINPK